MNAPKPLIVQALDLHRAGRLDEAEACYQQVLTERPDDFDALNLLGLLSLQIGRHAMADELLTKALQINPHSADAWSHHARVLLHLGHREEAVDGCRRAVALRPGDAQLHEQLGSSLDAAGRTEESIDSFDRAIALDASLAPAHHRRGLALTALGRPGEAVMAHERACQLAPQWALARQALAHAWHATGCQLQALGRLRPALAAIDRALAVDAGNGRAHAQRGIMLGQAQQHAAALSSLDRAIALDPTLAEAHLYRGHALRELSRFDESLCAFERAFELDPTLPFLRGARLVARMRVADWRDAATELAAVADAVRRGEPACPPFQALGLFDDPRVQRLAAHTWLSARGLVPAQAGQDRAEASPSRPPEAPELAPSNPVPPGDRLPPVARSAQRPRVGYFSADFNDHALAHLVTEFIESHDRQRIETFAFSYGPTTGDAMQQRIAAGVEHFVDVRARSGAEIAALARQHGIDVAVDMQGYTRQGRIEIFAARAAPVQVAFLSYVGTTALPAMDYLIADAHALTPAAREQVTECVAWLPDSFMPYDGRRVIGSEPGHRSAAGLPAEGFVFCCMNNLYKIQPGWFDVWMRILRRVPGSLLWLVGDTPSAQRNLQREVAQRDVDPGRLVFAPRVPLPQHMARFRLADLFLDTWPYNAHTTACDALFAGLPVLTCPGHGMAARVAGSLLHAVGLPNLVATSAGYYEDLAVELATRPGRLHRLRQALHDQRGTHPLFDAARFARYMEDALEAMHARHRDGLPPQDFEVPRRP